MVRVNEELKKLIPELSEDEYSILEKSVIAEGVREPIVLWNDTIVDGHNRYEIAMRCGINCPSVSRDFESIDDAKIWMIDNQKGRRNLTDGWKYELAQVKKSILLERGKKAQVRKPVDSVLSITDKTEHNTRNEIAEGLADSHQRPEDCRHATLGVQVIKLYHRGIACLCCFHGNNENIFKPCLT